MSRAIFVVDKDNMIRHVEYVKEVADHPNYEAALAVAKSLSTAGGLGLVHGYLTKNAALSTFASTATSKNPTIISSLLCWP